STLLNTVQERVKSFLADGRDGAAQHSRHRALSLPGRVWGMIDSCPSFFSTDVSNRSASTGSQTRGFQLSTIRQLSRARPSSSKPSTLPRRRPITPGRAGRSPGSSPLDRSPPVSSTGIGSRSTPKRPTTGHRRPTTCADASSTTRRRASMSTSSSRRLMVQAHRSSRTTGSIRALLACIGSPVACETSSPSSATSPAAEPRTPPASDATGTRLLLGCATIPILGDRGDVRLRPPPQRRNGLLQGPPELGQRVLHPRRSLGEDLSGHESVGDEGAQRRGEHFRGDSADGQADLIEPLRSGGEDVDDEHSPFVTDSVEHDSGRAFGIEGITFPANSHGHNPIVSLRYSVSQRYCESVSTRRSSGIASAMPRKEEDED